jgi:von Willebrand factor type A domain
MLARTLRSLALGLLLALPALADLAPEEWERARAEAARLAAKGGERDRKVALVATVRQEDSARAARLLLGFASASAKRRDDLAPRAAKAADDYMRIDRQLRKKHGRGVKREVLEGNIDWRKRREAFEQVGADLDAEVAVLAAIGEAFGALRSPEAALALADATGPDGAGARRAAEVREGIVAALLAQSGDAFDAALLAFGSDADLPYARVRVLDRVAARRIRAGFDVAAGCLAADHPIVIRAAIAALRALDEPRAVPPLVTARQRATGLVAEEIDTLLFRFTGKKFTGEGADAMWAGWWKSEGEAWLASAGAERFEGAPGARGGTDFYGIETRSNRIVFVLDRSQSMRLPVPQKGPVTGPKGDESVPGKTKLEVAKNQLERTIRKLAPDVKFGVIFFGGKFQAWQAPPALLGATPENKKAAIEWFASLAPEGSTPTFAALAEALRYAKVGGGKSATDPAGADTIYLLSDGAPSGPGGADLLLGPELDAEIARFLEANRDFKCVVHTVGVGPDHNRELMTRLARETGGTYRAVGVD